MNEKTQETVTIGCRLPKGITLEVGLQTTVKGGPANGLIPQVKRTKGYQRVTIKGTHWHNAHMFRQGIRPPSILAPEPYYTNNVSKAFWDEWCRTHADCWLLRSRNLFEVKSQDEKKIIVMDLMAQKAPLGPIDPSKPFVVGKDVVETADFKEG